MIHVLSTMMLLGMIGVVAGALIAAIHRSMSEHYRSGNWGQWWMILVFWIIFAAAVGALVGWFW